uniref:Uncharacterized protein n=1 Tax=Magallana gigas TaxID=29159 RepID=K1QPM2_MAGGI
MKNQLQVLRERRHRLALYLRDPLTRLYRKCADVIQNSPPKTTGIFPDPDSPNDLSHLFII